MYAVLALVGAIVAMAVAPLASATPTAVSAVASASATANATTSCIVASLGEACMFNMYDESVAACNSDYVSTLYCSTAGLWTLDQQCGSLEFCQCTDGNVFCS